MNTFIVFQYGYGIGHLSRCSAIAAALSTHSRVTLFSGGPPVDGYQPPGSVGFVQLPPMYWFDFEDPMPVSVDPNRSSEEAHRERGGILADAFVRQQPDVVVIEFFPFAPERLGPTLEPLLEAISKAGRRPLRVCSLRTVPRQTYRSGGEVEPAWINRRLRESFDLVLHHSDPVLFPKADMDPYIREAVRGIPVIQTGFVRKPTPAPLARPPSTGLVFTVGAGGGEIAPRLLLRWLAALEMLRPEVRLPPVHVVCGPLMSDEDRVRVRGLQAQGVLVHDSMPDLDLLLMSAEAVVCMGGYNTLIESLSLGRRVLAFPRSPSGEQWEQIARFASSGLLLAGDPRWETARVAQAIRELLAFQPAAPVQAEGAQRTAQILREWHGRRLHDCTPAA